MANPLEPGDAQPAARGERPWDAYHPGEDAYLHDPTGIHGLGHAARVLVWANVVGRSMLQQGLEVDLEVVRWAASLHDVRRRNDGEDPSHGERCGAWLAERSNAVGGLRRAEARTRDAAPHAPVLSDDQVKLLAYCCVWHVPPDREAPSMTPELTCLKDADALDRVRLGGLHTRFLRTACAKRLVRQAQFLCDYSEAQAVFRRDQWQAVRRAANRMNLWERLDDCESIRTRLRFFGV